MNIFEEEVRKMAEEIAGQERATIDSASERSQIASDVSRDWRPTLAAIDRPRVLMFRRLAIPSTSRQCTGRSKSLAQRDSLFIWWIAMLIFLRRSGLNQLDRLAHRALQSIEAQWFAAS